MINISTLKKGDTIRILVDYFGMALKVGDTLQVIGTGHSNWDRMDYAEVKTAKGYTYEIMTEEYDYELVK